MNFTDSSVLNVRASSSASLMTTAGGVSGSRSSSQIGHPQNQPIEHRHALGPPPFAPCRRSAGRSRRAAATVSRASAEANARSSSAGGSASGHWSVKNVSAARVDVAAADRPTDTESAAPPRAPGGGGPCRDARASRLRRSRRRLGASSCATTSAISIAATAASCPLLPVPSPARASASSTELVVSTPNAIGTPVAAAAVVRPVRHRRRDVFEVRRLAANQAAEADDGVEAPALRGVLRRQRDLERARHAHDRDVVRRDAGGRERRQRAGLQAVGHEVVVLRHHERKPKSRRAAVP